jgi:caffeoyl-CoA O-methyltransferase
MTDHVQADTNLQQQAKVRQKIEMMIMQMFAPEDVVLQQCLATAKDAGLPEIQISPIQGKFLQFLAVACNAQKILEIGSLAGYSGIWLARALPPDGHLITLEMNPEHAEIARNSFAKAGITDHTEVRVGKALDLLPHMESEGPFDLVFIDADKAPSPQYLEWALRLTRPGSIIIIDNSIRRGKALYQEEAQDVRTAGMAEYNKQVSRNPRLISLALAMDEDYTDGFTITVVLPEERLN